MVTQLWKAKFSIQMGIAINESLTATGGHPQEVGQMGPLAFLKPGTKVVATINGSHNSSTTTINVAAGCGVLFKSGTLFKVTVAAGTTEVFHVISVSTDALTVASRAFAGTAAALLGGETILPYYPAGNEHGSTVSTLPPGGDGIIEMNGLSWGSIIFPAEWTAADLAFYCSTSRGGTYVPMRDEDGAILQITGIATGAAGSYFIPLQVFGGGPFVKFKSITVGTDPTSAVAQAANRLLTVIVGE